MPITYPQKEVKLVGVTYENRQNLIVKLNSNSKVWLELEPTNKVDPNAIVSKTILNDQIYSIGYIAKNQTSGWYPLLNNSKLYANEILIIGGQISAGTTLLGIVLKF